MGTCWGVDCAQPAVLALGGAAGSAAPGVGICSVVPSIGEPRMVRTTDLRTPTPGPDGSQGPESESLGPLLYAELKTLAARAMRGERRGHTLQTTALVHEAWMRLSTQRQLDATDRDQILSLAAKMMRRVLVDHARRRLAAKRASAESVEDGPSSGLALGDHDQRISITTSTELLALDQALVRLEALNARQAQVVDLKFFAGLELEEIAVVLGVARPTVVRDWRMARAWLERELSRA